MSTIVRWRTKAQALLSITLLLPSTAFAGSSAVPGTYAEGRQSSSRLSAPSRAGSQILNSFETDSELKEILRLYVERYCPGGQQPTHRGAPLEVPLVDWDVAASDLGPWSPDGAWIAHLYRDGLDRHRVELVDLAHSHVPHRVGAFPGRRPETSMLGSAGVGNLAFAWGRSGAIFASAENGLFVGEVKSENGVVGIDEWTTLSRGSREIEAPSWRGNNTLIYRSTGLLLVADDLVGSAPAPHSVVIEGVRREILQPFNFQTNPVDPDQVVFAAGEGNKRDLYIGRLQKSSEGSYELKSVEPLLPGSRFKQSAEYLFTWSPDGKAIAFYSHVGDGRMTTSSLHVAWPGRDEPWYHHEVRDGIFVPESRIFMPIGPAWTPGRGLLFVAGGSAPGANVIWWAGVDDVLFRNGKPSIRSLGLERLNTGILGAESPMAAPYGGAITFVGRRQGQDRLFYWPVRFPITSAKGSKSCPVWTTP